MGADVWGESMRHTLCAAMFAVVAVEAASAAEYLTEITSEVYQAAGTPAELTAKANICMSRILVSGTEGGQVIVSSDPANGVVIANNVMSYQDGLLTWEARSKVTFEARDNRFRIQHTALERFNDQAGGWSPIGKWSMSGWETAQEAFEAVTAKIAGCVQNQKKEDW